MPFPLGSSLGDNTRAFIQAQPAQFTPALARDAAIVADGLTASELPQLRPSLNTAFDQIVRLDPQIADQLGQTGRKVADGLPRDQVSLPICPTTNVSDQVLFEAAANPTQKFYLPRYQIATQVVSGVQQYRVALQANGSGWQLVIYLAKLPAPELGAAAQTAAELPHEFAVILSYQIAGSGGAQKELAFSEWSQADGALRVALTVASIAERDELFRAMTTEGYHAQLIVRRAFRVAVQTNLPARPATLGLGDMIGTLPMPVPTIRMTDPDDPNGPVVIRPGPVRPLPFPRPLPLPALPTPNLVIKGTEDYEAGGQPWTRYLLSVSNWAEYPDELFAPAPDLPPCGNNTNAARTWVDINAAGGQRLYGFCALGSSQNLDSLWFAVGRGQPAPSAVYVTLTDRRTGRSVNSAPVEPPAIPRFHEVSAALDSTTNPFLFSPSLHGYIFRDITPQTNPASGLLSWTVAFQGASQHYFQEQARPYIFYYLPDSFKLVRRPDGARPPWMSARIATADGFHTETTTQVTLSYAVAPFVDADRLVAALPELASHIPPTASSGPQLVPLMTDAVRFIIERPLAVGAVLEERPTASVALRSAIHDTLTMPLADFQPLFEAMITPSATLFHGKVVVKVSGWPDEEISFTGRMDDMVGDLLAYAAVADPASGGLRVTLTNAIESNLTIGDLKAVLSRGAATTAAQIRELSLPIAQLAPGAQITFVVAPLGPVAGDGELAALFDLDQVKPVLDTAAIWEALVDESLSEFYRNVTVKAVPALFEPPAGRPDDQIVSIIVAFELGETIELTATRLEAAARVDLPIELVLLRHAPPTNYSYRVTAVRKSGQQQESTPAPRRDTLFYVDVVK